MNQSRPPIVAILGHVDHGKTTLLDFIRKIDIPEVNPDRVNNDLLKYEVVTEGKGGDVPVTLVSAKTGKGINELLETILFIASDLKLSDGETNLPLAYIIETK